MNHLARAARRSHASRALGPRTSQAIAWQLVIVAAVMAVVLRGPARWSLCVVVLAGLVLTTVRWRDRWAYEWALPAWEFWRAGRDQRRPGQEPLPVDVAAVRIRGGGKAALLHDGRGFAVIVSAEPAPGGPQLVNVPAVALASLIEPGDPVVSAVQVVVHADCGAGEVARSQTTWVVLRHDPMVSGFGVRTVGTSAEVHASLSRALAARGQRAVQILGSHGVRAELLTADEARAVLDDALVAGAGRAAPGVPVAGKDGGPAPRWWCWEDGVIRHVTYRVGRWPAAGLATLQSALSVVPACSVTTAVTLTPAPGGHPAIKGAVRVALRQETGASGSQTGQSGLDKRMRRAAASCGARLVPLHGEHASGLLATLPLGREPGGHRRQPAGVGLGSSAPVGAIPVSAGGLVIGTGLDGAPVTLPLFRATRGTRLCLVGGPALSPLLARALSAGVRVRVVTTREASWLELGARVGASADQMTVVPPGSRASQGSPGSPPPAISSRAAPCLVIDDTGAPPGDGGAWQAQVSVMAEVPTVPGALTGLDAVLFKQASPAAEAAIAAAFGLADSGTRLPSTVPDGYLQVVVPGSASVAWLAAQGERAQASSGTGL